MYEHWSLLVDRRVHRSEKKLRIKDFFSESE